MSEANASKDLPALIRSGTRPEQLNVTVGLSLCHICFARSVQIKVIRPRKIAYGMIVAAIAYALMAIGSFGLPMPQTEMGADGNPVAVHVADVTPNLLIMVYLVLTFGELLLSPMGISFVSKVAPPKYKGMMMGGWFVATAIGNQLVVVGGLLWGAVPLWVCWSVFLGVCLVAALFMFAMMKRLEKVC